MHQKNPDEISNRMSIEGTELTKKSWPKLVGGAIIPFIFYSLLLVVTITNVIWWGFGILVILFICMIFRVKKYRRDWLTIMTYSNGICAVIAGGLIFFMAGNPA